MTSLRPTPDAIQIELGVHRSLKHWITFLRFYRPEKPVFEKTWVCRDMELLRNDFRCWRQTDQSGRCTQPMSAIEGRTEVMGGPAN